MSSDFTMQQIEKEFDKLIEERAKKYHKRWIPCSKKNPKDLQEVVVTFLNHDPESYYKNIKDVPMTAFAVYFKNKWYWWTSTAKDFLSEYGDFPMYLIDDSIEITAWMPLPEPYKGENK